MSGKPATFTPSEIEGIEQIVSAGHKWLDSSNPAYPDLILKIGRAFLESQASGTPQELFLSETESWYLREVVPTSMRVTGEAVGGAIKKKLYPLLLQFDAERHTTSVVSQYGLSAVDDPLSGADVHFDQDDPAQPNSDRLDEASPGPDALLEQKTTTPEAPIPEEADQAAESPTTETLTGLDEADGPSDGIVEPSPSASTLAPPQENTPDAAVEDPSAGPDGASPDASTATKDDGTGLHLNGTQDGTLPPDDADTAELNEDRPISE